MACSMSPSRSRRTFAPATSSPAARAPRPRRTRGIRTSRIASPCAGACTCTAHTRRPPGRTTCRSPCTGAARGARPGVRSHPPKRIPPPFDRADLREGLVLVVAQVRMVPEGAGIRFRQVDVQDVPAVDLAPDRDPVHGDRDLLPLGRLVEGLLPAPQGLDPPEGLPVLAHEGLPCPDPAREDAHAEDRGF